MKCGYANKVPPRYVSLKDTQPYELYVAENGKIYYTTADTAACLTDGVSSFNNRMRSDVPVRRLDPGTAVTLTAE